MTTGSPASSSRGEKIRPRAGRTPSTEKYPSETRSPNARNAPRGRAHSQGEWLLQHAAIENVAHFTEVVELGVRHRKELCAVVRLVIDAHEPFWFANGRRPKEEPVHQREGQGRRCDSERQRRDDDQRDHWSSGMRAQTEPQITPQAIEPH